jgi:hypothetical protein
MTAPNGRTHGSAIDNRSEQVVHMTVPPAPMKPSTGPQFSNEEIKRLIAELEVPFDSAVIEWRVTNTTKSGKLRGQVIPYADPRAYTDRLNSLFTPAGWTRKYTVHTSANFERKPDQKTVAKVFVTCELTIFGLGAHSATGEESYKKGCQEKNLPLTSPQQESGSDCIQPCLSPRGAFGVDRIKRAA